METAVIKATSTGITRESIEARSKALGADIWRAMKDKGLTIQEAASASKHWHRDSLSRLIRGSGPPPRSLEGRLLADRDARYSALADVLGLHRDNFVAEVKAIQIDAEVLRHVDEVETSDEEGTPVTQIRANDHSPGPLRMSEKFTSVIGGYEASAYEDECAAGATTRASHVVRLLRVAHETTSLSEGALDAWGGFVDAVGRGLHSGAAREDQGIHVGQPSLTFGFDGRGSGLVDTSEDVIAGMSQDLRRLHRTLREAGESELLLRAIRKIGVLVDGTNENYAQVVHLLLASFDKLEKDGDADTDVLNSLRALLSRSLRA